MLVDELLVVGDDRLGDGLADGVDLRDVSTTADADADVDAGELVEADDEEGLVDLEDVNIWPVVYCAEAGGAFLRRCHRVSRIVGGISGVSYLESEDLGLDEGERLSVDLNKTLAGLLIEQIRQHLSIHFKQPFSISLMSFHSVVENLSRVFVPCTGRQR